MKAKKMKRSKIYFIILMCLIVLTLYMMFNKDKLIREHLSNGPPSLLSLQSDTKDLQSQITKLDKDLSEMKSTSSAQASQAAAARAQLAAAKRT
jgi:peptidoglycan hydrolase CwlO-like protein